MCGIANPEAALATGTTCIQLDATQSDCWLTLAVLKQDKKDIPGAIESWEKYLEHAPTGRYANSAKIELRKLKK